jgi:putative oxygen-independent coproporphyrinogen III oxidase
VTLPPLSLYVHLPWCVRKCPYCDFNSHTAGEAAPRARYIAALLADLEVEARRSGGRPLISIFLGGGTPSLFPPAELAELLAGIAGRFSFAADIEITLEANPGTVECGDPQGYRAAGINRLSVGAQSFDAAALRTLGRIHTVDDIARAVVAAQAAGFANINLDVMYGLPGQDVAAALADLRAATALAPSHLSWYQLTLEPNTVFHARPPPNMPDDDLCGDIQVAGQAYLSGCGYAQYEVSAYARERQHCRHNVNYWSFGDYLAVGAGAHGKLTDAAGIWRYSKPANPLAYMQAMERGSPETELQRLDERELVFEFMLNALRLNAPFDLGLFSQRTRLPGNVLATRLSPATDKGLLEELAGAAWRVTDLGQRFLNDLQAEFLP